MFRNRGAIRACWVGLKNYPGSTVEKKSGSNRAQPELKPFTPNPSLTYRFFIGFWFNSCWARLKMELSEFGFNLYWARINDKNAYHLPVKLIITSTFVSIQTFESRSVGKKFLNEIKSSYYKSKGFLLLWYMN